MTIKRIGFACKWIDSPAEVAGVGKDNKDVNTRTTTEHGSIAKVAMWLWNGYGTL